MRARSSILKESSLQPLNWQVEIPVEKIIYKDKLVEIPVEKIIEKEVQVPVETIVYKDKRVEVYSRVL